MIYFVIVCFIGLVLRCGADLHKLGLALFTLIYDNVVLNPAAIFTFSTLPNLSEGVLLG